MIKVVYASLVFLLSSAIVLLTKGNSHQGKCALEVTGIVTSHGNTSHPDLIIVTSDNKKFLPQITNEEVVLVQGQKVKVCANPVGLNTDSLQVIAIHQIAVLP